MGSHSQSERFIALEVNRFDISRLAAGAKPESRYPPAKVRGLCCFNNMGAPNSLGIFQPGRPKGREDVTAVASSARGGPRLIYWPMFIGLLFMMGVDYYPKQRLGGFHLLDIKRF